MSVVFMGVKCYPHPFGFFVPTAVSEPVSVIKRGSIDTPTVQRSPQPEVKPRPKSAEPTPSPRLRASPALSEEARRQILATTAKVDKSFKIGKDAKMLADVIKREKVAEAGDDQEREWAKLCHGFKESACRSAGSIAIGKQIMGDVFDIDHVEAEDLYVEVLHHRIVRLLESKVKMLDKIGLFKKYKPMVLYRMQKEFTQDDMIPSTIDNYMPYEAAVNAKLLPVNIETYMNSEFSQDKKWTFCCVGLFYSFVHRVNFVSGYWKSSEGEWKSQLVNFDRFDDPDTINI